MTDDLELQIAGPFGTRESMRLALDRQSPEIMRAVQTLESDQRPYSVTVTLADWKPDGPHSLAGTLQSLMTDILDPAPEPKSSSGRMLFLRELNASAIAAGGEPEMRISLRGLTDASHVPAGTLLVDASTLLTAPETEIAPWTGSIREALSSNVLARSDAEYALVVDLLGSATEDRCAVLRWGIDLAQSVTETLPAEPRAEPNLVDLSVRLADVQRTARAQARARIWRLGFMKVPSRSRFA